MFIVIEGIDGTGKSSVITKLHGKLPNSIVTRTPGGDPEVGPMLRKILLSKNGLTRNAQAMLFMADMIQVDENIIRPALNNGLTVLCDRFYMSTYIYQLGNKDVVSGIKNLKYQGLFTTPDYTFILDAPAEVAMGRMGKEKDRYESDTIDIWESRRAQYLAQANNKNTMLISTVDKNVEEVTNIILERIRKDAGSDIEIQAA